MVYLALRKTDSPGFLKGLFSKYTRWKLKTRYPHVGIVCAGRLCHATAKDNLHWSDFDPVEFDLFEIDVSEQLIYERYELVKDDAYDWLGLLAFLLPIKIGEKNKLYCCEWAWFASTGELPEMEITPEKLLVQSWPKK